MLKALRSTLAVLVLACPALAHADTIQAYGFQATLSNGTTAAGSVLFDETTGMFTDGSIFASLGGSNYAFTTFGGSAAYDSVTFANFYDAASDIFQVVIPGNNDVNYAGGSICSTASFTGCMVTNGGGAFYVTSTSLSSNGTNAYATGGTLTATPEPSSLILLGTGLLGLAGAARRRFAL